MGAGSEDTQREIGTLRSDMSAALAELRGRVGSGPARLAAADARVSAQRSVQQVRENPSALLAGGALVMGLAGFTAYAAVNRWRESRKPQNRVRARAHDLRSDVEDWLGQSRERVDRARHEDLLVKLQPEHGGYVRVADARLGSAGSRQRKTNDVVKKLIWAVLLSLFTAVASVVARRAAAQVWQSTVGEKPPTEEKDKQT